MLNPFAKVSILALGTLALAAATIIPMGPLPKPGVVSAIPMGPLPKPGVV